VQLLSSSAAGVEVAAQPTSRLLEAFGTLPPNVDLVVVEEVRAAAEA